MLQSFGFRCLGVVVLALVSSWVSAQALSDLDAVHDAAQLRTLAMRAAKAHVQLAVNGNDDKVWRQLTDCVVRYDDTLAQLEASATGPDLNHRLQDLRAQWQRYKTIALSEPSRSSVLKMLDASNNLLVQTDGLMRQWQSRLPLERGGLDTLAQQQAMLSERVGLYYAALAYGVDAPWVRDELHYSVSAFEKGMKQLQSDSVGGHDNRLLGLLQNQWNYIRSGLQQSTHTTSGLALNVAMESLYTESNQLGERFHKQDRIAMNMPSVGVGLAAYVTDD